MDIYHKELFPLGLILYGLFANAASAAPTLSLGSVTQALPGQTVNIPVTFDNDVTVAGLQFDVQYDAAQLNVGATLAGGVLTATGHGVASAMITADTLRVVIAPPGNNAVLPAGEVATLSWVINSAAPGGPLGLIISNAVFTDRGAATVAAGALTHGNIGINHAPVADNKTIATNEDQAVAEALIATDNDHEPLVYSIVAYPRSGSIILTNPATGAFTYTPNANVNGSDSFTFQASDGKVASNVATVTINISPVNDAPVLNPIGAQSVNEGTAKTIALSATDVDSGDRLSFNASGLPAFATLTDNGDGTASLSLAPDYAAAGAYAIVVTVTDNGTPSLSASEAFTLTINNVNVQPTVQAGPDQSTHEGLAVTLAGAGIDPDGTISRYAWTQIGGMAITLNNANTATAGFTAPAVTSTTYLTFRLTVTDNDGATGSDEVTVVVIPTGKPDLILSAIGSPLTAKAGANITLSNTVANKGTADAVGNFDVGVYLIPELVVFAGNVDTDIPEDRPAWRNGSSDEVNNDFHDGLAPLSIPVSDFELTLYTKRPNKGAAKAYCYSLIDANGHGYGLCLDFASATLTLNKQTAWEAVNLGTAADLPGGTVINTWYTLQLIKQGPQLTANVYLGKAATVTPTAAITAIDSSYTSFNQVNVDDRHSHPTSNVKVVQLVGDFPSGGSEIFIGKRTVFSLAQGTTSEGDITATIPSTVAAGTYAIAAKADMYSTITETNEANNVLFGTRLFVVTPPRAKALRQEEQ